MIKVVYIVAKGRSGSTLLDRVLGHVGGWVSTGEIWRLWDWGLHQHYLCGCGEPIESCPFWLEVLDRAFGSDLDADRGLALRDQVLRWPAAPGLVARRKTASSAAPYLGLMRQLYEAVAAVSGAEVVVDSSKFPFDPLVLGMVPGVDPYALQIVRDPRAVAFSWTRDKRADFQPEPDARMKQFSPVHSSLSWGARNGVAELVRLRSKVPWQTMRYEDFVAAPRDELDRLLQFVGTGSLPEFVDDHTVLLGGHHMIGGNPSRKEIGPVEIRADDEWRDALPARARAVVTTMTYPLLKRYGY